MWQRKSADIPAVLAATWKVKCGATRKTPQKAEGAGKEAEVKSRKQAIAIGLSKARKKGEARAKKTIGPQAMA